MASVTLDRRPVFASRSLRTFTRRPALLAFAGTAVLAALARVPYLTVGVGPDEGGYAYVARQWGRGAALYRDVWIDRPRASCRSTGLSTSCPATRGRTGSARC